MAEIPGAARNRRPRRVARHEGDEVPRQPAVGLDETTAALSGHDRIGMVFGECEAGMKLGGMRRVDQIAR